MESDRFDTLTAWLSAQLSRRRSVSLLSALGVTSVAAWESATAGTKNKKRKKKKKKKSGCASGLTNCQGQCIDFQNDRTNCGECYSECRETQECRQGACLPPCSERACFERKFGGYETYYPVAAAADNTLAVVTDEDSIEIFRLSGELVRTIGEFGVDPGEFDEPSGVAVRPNGAIYASDTYNHRIQVFRPNGDIDVWPMGRDYLGSLAVTSDGTVYVAKNGQITRLNESGAEQYGWGPDGTPDSDFGSTVDVEIDASGAILVLDGYGNKLYRFRDGGQDAVALLGSFGTPGVDPGEFRNPRGLAVSSNEIFVADSDNQRIQVFGLDDGSYRYSWPVTDDDGLPADPLDLVVSAGRAYVATYFGVVVYRITP